MPRLYKHRFYQGVIVLLVMGTLSALAGCQSEVQTSADYQKLPPGEGAKRMTDTLQRRASVKAGHATPPPPSYSSPPTSK